MNWTAASRYWVFQIFGWSLYALINVFFAGLFDQLTGYMLIRLLFFLEVGLFFSHLMRETIHRSAVLMKSLQYQVINFIILTLVFAMLMALVQVPFEIICDLRTINVSERAAFHLLFFKNFSTSSLLLFIWNSIYFMYHYVMKSRKQQMDTLQLEALVKELELKTIKAHINPHFIFNSLNSIRALIDEDPNRARNAITELSNILRSSMQTDKLESVSLEKELNIVKDYLALENMRFEDRLRVEYEIDEDTLDQPVPPMMLQTLVENAIKHGISKQVSGGTVRVVADFKDDHLELLVQNTGQLSAVINGNGFGIKSTEDRLNLMYQGKAAFEIK